MKIKIKTKTKPNLKLAIGYWLLAIPLLAADTPVPVHVATISTETRVSTNYTSIGVMKESSGTNVWDVQRGQILTQVVSTNYTSIGVMKESSGTNVWDVQRGQILTQVVATVTFKGVARQLVLEEAHGPVLPDHRLQPITGGPTLWAPMLPAAATQ